jgi:hypothetical protein
MCLPGKQYPANLFPSEQQSDAGFSAGCRASIVERGMRWRNTMSEDDTDRAARIRALNDRLRCENSGGQILITPGVAALGPEKVVRIWETVAKFDNFTEDNDPHGEHDFGSFEIDGESFFWKIDYYDASLEFGSEDPADPDKTTRVLTILRADEY